MLKVAVGHSNHPDSLLAIQDAIAQCQNTLAGMNPQAGLIFMAVDFDYSLVLQELQTAFPGIEVVGCSSNGELSDHLGFQQDSIALTLFCSDTLTIKAGVGRNVSKDAIAAAQEAIQQARCDAPPQLCLTVPESLTANGTEMLQALQTCLGQEFPIYGGLAAEEWQFQETHQFYHAEVLQDSLPILLFSGTSLKFSHGVCSGYQPLSAPGIVTKSDRNVLYEIDHQTALDFYRKYFGELNPSPNHPFAVFDEKSQHFYLRGFSGFDPVVGSITAFADVPIGASIQMATASRDDLLIAAKESMQEALQSYPGSRPEVAIVFSCACRHKLLWTRAKEESTLIQSFLDSIDVPVATCGFYTYGELSPLKDQRETRLHQHTLVTLLLGTT